MSRQALIWSIWCRNATLGLLKRSPFCHHTHLTHLHMAVTFLSAVWLLRVEVKELLEMASSLCDPRLSPTEEYFYSCFCFAYSWCCLWDECIKWVTAAMRSAFWLLCRTFLGLGKIEKPCFKYILLFHHHGPISCQKQKCMRWNVKSFIYQMKHAFVPSHSPAPCFILCLCLICQKSHIYISTVSHNSLFGIIIIVISCYYISQC